MTEHPVLPDLSPAKGLRELLVVGVQAVAIIASLLGLLALAAFLVERQLLAAAFAMAMVAAGLVADRLRASRRRLEAGEL